MAKASKRTTAYKTSRAKPKRKHEDAKETVGSIEWRLRHGKVLSVTPLRGSRTKD